LQEEGVAQRAAKCIQLLAQIHPSIALPLPDCQPMLLGALSSVHVSVQVRNMPCRTLLCADHAAERRPGDSSMSVDRLAASNP
jgi:hypothetical protein